MADFDATAMLQGWMAGRRLAAERSRPPYVFDPKSKSLKVFRDDGSLSYSFDTETFKLSVEEV